MKGLTIRARITLLCTLLAAAVSALALAGILTHEQRMVSAYFQDSLTSTIQLAEDDIRIEDGKLEIDRNLDELPNVRVAIYSADGDLIYGRHSFMLDFEEDALRYVQGRSASRWAVQDSLLQFEDGTKVWLRCYMSADAVENMRGFHREVLLVMFPGLIALAALGGWLIARKAFLPISRIIETAESIADGVDLKKRIGLSGVQDEIYRTAAVFDGMLERLEGAFERERRFTSDASHELRTPVAAIIAQSEQALAENAAGQDRMEAFERIHETGMRMSALIQRLLELSRLDAKQHLEDVESVDLVLIAQAVAQGLEERAAQRHMSICADTGACMYVRGDALMLAQAAVNLAENALNHGWEGGKIRLEVRRVNGECRFSVSDNGPGIPDDQLAHLFDRFYQADASRHSGGFGLGLPLVKRIVELHGGRMEVRSETGRGSCFEMVIPAQDEQEEADD